MDFDSNILLIERLLYDEFGDLNWWPANTSDEVVIGAILTQNTSWGNVERAISNLREENLLKLKSISESSRENISRLIRPSGFYNQKADRLLVLSTKIISEFGSLDKLSKRGMDFCTEYLSNLKGVGKETLDSILLYAMNMPRFVVDKYTIRFFLRIGLLNSERESNEFEKIPVILDYNVNRLKNLHAMIVEISKKNCKSKPFCESCIMKDICKYYKERILP